MERIHQNLPALIVVLPLCMGLITSIIGRRGLGWWLATCKALTAQIAP